MGKTSAQQKQSVAQAKVYYDKLQQGQGRAENNMSNNGINMGKKKSAQKILQQSESVAEAKAYYDKLQRRRSQLHEQNNPRHRVSWTNKPDGPQKKSVHQDHLESVAEAKVYYDKLQQRRKLASSSSYVSSTVPKEQNNTHRVWADPPGSSGMPEAYTGLTQPATEELLTVQMPPRLHLDNHEHQPFGRKPRVTKKNTSKTPRRRWTGCWKLVSVVLVLLHFASLLVMENSLLDFGKIAALWTIALVSIVISWGIDVRKERRHCRQDAWQKYVEQQVYEELRRFGDVQVDTLRHKFVASCGQEMWSRIAQNVRHNEFVQVWIAGVKHGGQEYWQWNGGDETI